MSASSTTAAMRPLAILRSMLRTSFLSRLPVEPFMLAMLTAVGLAVVAPGIGAHGSALHLDQVTQIGIGFVFLLHGMALSTEKMKQGASNWRLHLFIQLSTFALFPLIGMTAMKAFGARLPPDLMLGFVYLCTLSSTISSSVAMTALARGNVPGAIFNATLSSLIGMAATPLLVGLMVHTSGAALPLGDAIRNVALQLFLPFTVGQLLRPWTGAWIARHKERINLIDRGVILLIVYGSFCDSTAAGLWRDYSVGTLFTVAALAGALLVLVLLITTWASRRLGFSKEDEIAAVFCGSKKSLAAGAPIAKLLFGAHAGLGMIVLPLMLYHQMQLLLCSVLARRYAERQAAPGSGVEVAL